MKKFKIGDRVIITKLTDDEGNVVDPHDELSGETSFRVINAIETKQVFTITEDNPDISLRYKLTPSLSEKGLCFYESELKLANINWKERLKK